jgi:hypothetical protein
LPITEIIYYSIFIVAIVTGSNNYSQNMKVATVFTLLLVSANAFTAPQFATRAVGAPKKAVAVAPKKVAAPKKDTATKAVVAKAAVKKVADKKVPVKKVVEKKVVVKKVVVKKVAPKAVVKTAATKAVAKPAAAKKVAPKKPILTKIKSAQVGQTK